LAVVTKTFTFTNGTVADATEVNTNFDTLYTLQNGNIDNDNLDTADDYTWTGNHTFTTAFKINSSSVLEFGGALNPGWVSNLGMSLSGGTLTIVDAGGAALSASNPGFVTVPSTTGGQLVTLKVTAGGAFNDDANASSDLTNLGFGITEASDRDWETQD